MILLELKNIIKTYTNTLETVKVLDNISLQINAPEMLSILGPSGSGKSSLMNILGLLDNSYSGEYILKGQNLKNLGKDDCAHLRNKTFGFVFQQFHLLPRLSAFQNVGLPLNYRRISKDAYNDQITLALKEVGMLNFAHRLPSQLSGGQQQRIAIARAIVTEPDIILADEPTGALDSKTSVEIINFFKSLKEARKTVIIVTHDPNVAACCDRQIHISDGKIVC